MLPALWGYVEADFRREYGIRLIDELPRMGWHEFKNLLMGLSPDCALHRNLRTQPRRGRAAADGFWQGVAAVGGRNRKE